MLGDFTTDNLRYKTTERFSINYTDWRAVYGTSDDKLHHCSPRNGVALTNVAHPMSADAFRALIADGLNEVFSQVHDDNSEEWDSAFTLSPESLEEIEIGFESTPDATLSSGRVSILQRVAIQDAWPDGSGKSERLGALLLPDLSAIRKR